MEVSEIVAALRGSFQQPFELVTSRATPSVLVPEGFTEHVIPRLSLAQPQRVEQTITTRRIADFIAYVKKYKNDDSLLVIAPEVKFDGKAIVSAIIDYHRPPPTGFEPPAARWGFHTVHYVPQISPAYALLTGFADKLLSQDVFTQSFRDVMRFVTSMPTGDMLELVRTLNLTSTGEFKSVEDPITGSVDFAYNVQVQAQAGTADKRLTIPEQITFKMPILHDGEAVDIVAELRYRVPKADEGSKKVQLGLTLINRVWDEFDQLATLGARVANETSLLTIVGGQENKYVANSKEAPSR